MMKPARSAAITLKSCWTEHARRRGGVRSDTAAERVDCALSPCRSFFGAFCEFLCEQAEFAAAPGAAAPDETNLSCRIMAEQRHRRACRGRHRQRAYLPPLTYTIEDMVANMTCTCPPSRSISAGPAPRYGTCTRLTPVIILNSSPAIWFPEPMPADAILILPGLALAWVMNSGTVLTGTDGFTSMTKGSR